MFGLDRREKASIAARHLLEQLADEVEIDRVSASIATVRDDQNDESFNDFSSSQISNRNEPFLMYQLLPILEIEDESDCKLFTNHRYYFLRISPS